MSRWRSALGAAALCAGASVAAAEPCPALLRLGFSDRAAPPGLLGNGAHFNDPPGWAVVAVRDAARRLGCAAELVRLPARRLSAALAQGDVHFALVYGVTPERLKIYAFPLDAQGRPDVAWALIFGHLTLFSRAGTEPDPAWDGQQLAPRWRVGALAGSLQEAMARERGWAVEPVAAFDSEVAMLQAQRFDLLLTVREALTPEQRADLVAWAPPVALEPYFAPANPAFAQRHGEWTRAFWTELCHAMRRQSADARPVDCGVVPPPPRRRASPSD